MKVRLGAGRWKVLTATALATIVASTVPGTVSAVADSNRVARSENWGVIPRNTIGSPVAALRFGPVVPGNNGRPPYGNGSLGFEVAGKSAADTNDAEKADFGNAVDFVGENLLQVDRVGFQVFQTTENLGYGDPNDGSLGGTNLPSIRFELDPNLSSSVDNYTVAVWRPDPVPVASLNRWSGYLDAARTGSWYLTGGETACNQAARCTFDELQTSLDDGGDAPSILTFGVSKGRDYAWVGAVDGLRLNQYVYDFEANGVNARRVR
ncbi:hypothetical protein AB8A21_03955 [Streptomyces sp. BF23-18]|uniref:hypothetical protein n=1 Tax=Streptomyces sp. BF23-18 TaxID=3240282 RepID=UPI0034E4B085